MRKISIPDLNVVLAVGILCIVAGIFLSIRCAGGIPAGFPVVPSCAVFMGALFVYLALAFIHKTLLLYIGLVVSVCGALYLLIITGIMPGTIRQLWPLAVVVCGVALFPAGLFRFHHARTVYLFPAGLLIFLGSAFLLFSLDVISVPFTRFVALWWPLFLILFGVILVVIFLYQQQYHNLFPYVPDDDTDSVPQSRGDFPE